MSYEETMSYSEFEREWVPDDLNIVVKAYWFKDVKNLEVTFAHPRKLTCSQITVTHLSKDQALAWIESNRPARIEMVEL